MTKETNAAVVSFEEQQAAYYFPSEAQTKLLFGRNPIREAIKANRYKEKLLDAKGDLSGSAREIDPYQMPVSSYRTSTRCSLTD